MGPGHGTCRGKQAQGSAQKGEEGRRSGAQEGQPVLGRPKGEGKGRGGQGLQHQDRPDHGRSARGESGGEEGGAHQDADQAPGQGTTWRWTQIVSRSSSISRRSRIALQLPQKLLIPLRQPQQDGTKDDGPNDSDDQDLLDQVGLQCDDGRVLDQGLRAERRHLDLGQRRPPPLPGS